MVLLKQIKVHKSSGLDNISSKVLKDSLITLASQTLYLINLSIRTNRFPNAWNRGTVVPLPKVNNPTKVGDLRPITLLPIPSKLIEKIVYSQMTNFLENNRYMNNNQYGFRKNKSTIDAAFKFVNDLYSNDNNKLITSAVFIDYKKAFDSISHETLLQKLHRFHISNTVHFGYSGHLGPHPSVHYIRMSTICEVSSIGGVREQSRITVLIDICIIILRTIEIKDKVVLS